MTLEEALVSVWKQPLIDGATTVELEGRKHTVKKTSRHHLRQVDFSFEGQQLRGLERNPHTQSRWARLAQEGKRIMQFLRAGRYVAVVEMKRWLLTSEGRAPVEWWAWIPQRARRRRIGGLQSQQPMILRHTNDRVTKKHYIKPPSIESTVAMGSFL